MSSSSSSPCAACKCLRRKCTQECVFAPYFPPDNPQKFSNVHKVFGASNVAKLLNELNPSQREDAVNSLAYEAEYRLRDPVYGCVGLISILQHKLKQVQQDLDTAKKELAAYMDHNAVFPILNHRGFIPQNAGYGSSAGYRVMPYNMQPMLGLQQNSTPLMVRDSQQILEAQQLAAVAAREQEMMRTYNEQQNELARFNSGFKGEPVTTVSGFSQMTEAEVQPCLALGQAAYHHQIQQNHDQLELSHSQAQSHQLQPQQMMLQQQQQSGGIQSQQLLAQPEAALLPARDKGEEARGVCPN